MREWQYVCVRERAREIDRAKHTMRRKIERQLATILYAVFRGGAPRLTLLSKLLRLTIYAKGRPYPQKVIAR